jgi:hypothetical protein
MEGVVLAGCILHTYLSRSVVLSSVGEVITKFLLLPMNILILL